MKYNFLLHTPKSDPKLFFFKLGLFFFLKSRMTAVQRGILQLCNSLFCSLALASAGLYNYGTVLRARRRGSYSANYDLYIFSCAKNSIASMSLISWSRFSNVRCLIEIYELFWLFSRFFGFFTIW